MQVTFYFAFKWATSRVFRKVLYWAHTWSRHSWEYAKLLLLSLLISWSNSRAPEDSSGQFWLFNFLPILNIVRASYCLVLWKPRGKVWLSRGCGFVHPHIRDGWKLKIGGITQGWQVEGDRYWDPRGNKNILKDQQRQKDPWVRLWRKVRKERRQTGTCRATEGQWLPGGHSIQDSGSRTCMTCRAGEW